MSEQVEAVPLAAAKVYTLAEVAALLHTSTRLIRRWVDARRFPLPLNLPGPWKFRRSEVDRFIDTSVIEVKPCTSGKDGDHA